MDMWLVAASTPQETQEERLERALVNLGAEELEKLAGEAHSPRLDRLAAQVDLAEQMGRDLAYTRGEELLKEAGFTTMMSGAANVLKPIAGKALGMAAKNPAATLGIGGAAVGGLTAPSGHRLRGALTGGAIGYGAGRMGASGGVQSLANRGLGAMGMPKVALALPGALAAGGALAGGIAGALHKSPAERAGLAPGHHLRNALVGAAGGAGLGLGAGKAAPLVRKTLSGPGVGGAGGNVLSKMKATPMGAAKVMAPEEVSRIRGLMEQGAHGDPRRLAWIQKNNPHLYPEMAGPATGMGRPPTHAVAQGPAPPGTVVGKRSSRPVDPTGATMVDKTAGVHGAALLKLAWSTEMEKDAGPPPIPAAAARLVRKPPPIPHPAISALKHLTPQGMHALQSVPLTKTAVSDQWVKRMVQSGAEKAPLSSLSKFTRKHIAEAGRLNNKAWGANAKHPPNPHTLSLQKKHWDAYETARNVELDRLYGK